MKKAIIIAGSMLIIIISLLIQINFLNYINAFGVIANIGIVVVCAIGISAGSYTGGVVGFIYGLLSDIFFSKTLGVYVLLYLAIGLFAGYFKNKISKDNKMSLALTVLIGTMLFESALCVFSIAIGNISFNGYYLLKVIIIEILYNLFITYMLFRPLIYWGELINRSRDSYYFLH